ncbi:MAG TPA: hypothetical protein VNH63_07955 [Gemmatimonadales bacterium]|nr:hypothetical protein [Gemmatimonadales bacterium]
MSPRPYSWSLAEIGTLIVLVAANAFGARVLLHPELPARRPAAARAAHRAVFAAGSPGVRRGGAPVEVLAAPVAVAAAPVDTVPRAPVAAAPRIRLVEEPLRVHAAPREFQIVTVPVPATLPGDSAVRFEIRPTGTATILGQLRGVIAAGGGPRTLVFTVSVPAHALAGKRLIAQIDFAAGATAVTVPVELVVEQVHGAAIAFRQQTVGARRGDEVTVPYLLTNSGNGPDTFLVALVVPSTWHGPSLSAPVAAAAGATVTGQATLYIPRTWGTGLATVHVIAYGPGGVERASGATDVQVIDPAAEAAAQGPELTAGAAMAFSDTGAGSSAVGFQIFGSVAPGTFVSGRLALATRAGSDVAALGRVGYFVGTPYLTVTAPTWQGTIGTAGRSFTPATGMDLWGAGGSFAWHGPRFDAAAFAAQPKTAGGGHLVGVEVGEKVASGWIGLTATDLEDDAGAGRRLTAVGVSATGPAPFGATATGELAYRHYAGGSGLGVAGQFERRTPGAYLDLRFRSTPGGTAAFARARTEISGTASRAVSDRLWLTGGLWSTSDRNAVFSRLSGWGGSFTPQLTLTPQTTLAGDASYTSTNAASAAGTFGFAQGRAHVGVTQTFGILYAGATAGAGILHQDVRAPSGASSNATAGQQTLSGRAGAALERVTVELTAQYDHTGAGVGYLPSQLAIGAHAQHLAVVSGAHSPLLSLAVDRTTWFGMRQGVTTARAGLSAELPWNMALAVQVERNGFVTNSAGTVPWLAAVKLEHRLAVPVTFGATAARGVVYADLNANGQRDHGEPGISNVVVRRGGEMVVTDRGGQFRFAQPSSAVPQVDETSLPFGLIANVGAPGRIERGNRFEIAVTPTADAEVEVVPTAGPDGRLPRVDLTGSVIHLRDQAGNYWSARADSAGRAVFHALPPGQYTPELDLTGLAEPLRPGTAPTPFVVAPGQPVPAVVIPVFPRPVRLFDPSNPGHGARGAGTAPAQPSSP